MTDLLTWRMRIDSFEDHVSALASLVLLTARLHGTTRVPSKSPSSAEPNISNTSTRTPRYRRATSVRNQETNL